MRQARSGGGAEGLGGSGGGSSAFDEFRRMEDKIETQGAEVAAAREVDEAMRGSSVADADLEAKFRALESGRGGTRGAAGGSDVDDELAALKKKVRIGS